jgi:signal transduction histidine kinase
MIFRPLHAATTGLLGVLVISLLLAAMLAWRSDQRLDEVQEHFMRAEELQRSSLRLQLTAVEQVVGDAAGERQKREALRVELGNLLALGVHRDATAPSRLREALRLLEDPSLSDRRAVLESLRIFRSVTERELATQAGLMTALHRDTSEELILAFLAGAALIGAGAVILLYAWRRILGPLHSLGSLVSRLAQGEFTPVPLGEVDPLLRHLFINYNQLVSRLQELEAEHRSRAESLEREVRQATRALLEQQRSLSRAERLAAAGEMAASLAHELRNPLAAIQVSLSNLRQDLDDADARERLDLVLDETQRLGRLLNEILDASRHAPEEPSNVKLASTVRQLIELTRYQLPQNVELTSRIPDHLSCVLPEGRLRQALLNLVLNAAQALGTEGGGVELSAQTETDGLSIQVRDDGPGFERQVLERGIRPFVSSRKRGTGLGLAIVRRFAADMAGQVELANLEGGGACVTLTLHCEVSHGRDAAAD